MFLVVITLLILVVVIVSYLFLDRKIVTTFDDVLLLVKEANVATSAVFDTTELITDHQKALDDKMDALAAFVDAHSTNAAFQQEQFNVLVKADMLSARREELRRTKELKIALERLMGVALTSRQPPAPNDVLALENLTTRIEELESILK